LGKAGKLRPIMEKAPDVPAVLKDGSNLKMADDLGVW
jgi:hypothetical protein